MTTKICLAMIVKNEAAVIRRCLESVRPIIDHWVIVDTGSTDGTQDMIREYLRDLPGELHERPWRDFAHNRSEALVLARPHGDYSLIIDADDTVEIPEGFHLPELTADSYMLDIQDTSVRYRRTQLVRNTMPWRYQGVLHEFLTCDGAQPGGHLPVVMRRGHDGARRRDPQTYRKDAAILEGALLTETDPFLISRYTFYLAQSYRDCGEKEKALKHYLARGELGFWQEEVFVALLWAARMKQALGHPEKDVIEAYVRAAGALPTRAEAWHSASLYCRIKNRFQEGYKFAQRGLKIALPEGGLFVEAWIYDYGLLDELAINAYWTERYAECVNACDQILTVKNLPTEAGERVRKNKQFAIDRLQEISAKPEQRVAEREQDKVDNGIQIPVDEDDFTRLLKGDAKLSSATLIDVISAARRLKPKWAERLLPGAVLAQQDLRAWLELCEFYHDQLDWNRLYWSCYNGLSLCALSSTAAKDWGWRLQDLMALACSHLGMAGRAVDHGRLAAELKSGDPRLASNLSFYRQQLHDVGHASLRRFRIERISASSAHTQTSEAPARVPIPDAQWQPDRPLAGTELMVEGLRSRLGQELQRVDLEINMFDPVKRRDRPLVLWMHHDIDQAAVQWCRDVSLVDKVSSFVFVSHWQKDRYIGAFPILAEKCTVLRNATTVPQSRRVWRRSDTLRFAYTSTPFRGLSILLDAWDVLDLQNAELHIWSSMKLYAQSNADYADLIDRARHTPGVVYHGLLPREELLTQLRDIHFLAYPCTFAETSCIAAIDAMAAGCRLIVPDFGALPETTAGFARMYPWSRTPSTHTDNFVHAIRSEVSNPWDGNINLALDQQNYAEIMFDWQPRIMQWRHLIAGCREVVTQ